MRARVLVGEISRRSTGATRSGLIGKSRLSSWSEPGPMLSPACNSSSFSGSMLMESVSTVAEAAMAPAMISPCVIRLSTRASISPSRKVFR
jgi:hypothetical protein